MNKIDLYKGDFYKSELTKWFRKLSTKDKNKFLKFTYLATAEPKAQQRIRGFYMFCKSNNIENLEQLKNIPKELTT
jgi:hypothetical protein